MLTRYAGAIGMKTGYTKKAGRGLIAAATRNGRTQIVVVLNVVDMYGWAAQLLDAAFATPVPAHADRLPAIRPALRIAPAPLVVTTSPKAVIGTDPAVAAIDNPTDVEVAVATSEDKSSGMPLIVRSLLWTVAALAAAWCVLRARVVFLRQRRRRRRANARVRRHVNRRRDPQLTPHYRPQEDMADRFHTAGRS